MLKNTKLCYFQSALDSLSCERMSTSNDFLEKIENGLYLESHDMRLVWDTPFLELGNYSFEMEKLPNGLFFSLETELFNGLNSNVSIFMDVDKTWQWSLGKVKFELPSPKELNHWVNHITELFGDPTANEMAEIPSDYPELEFEHLGKIKWVSNNIHIEFSAREQFGIRYEGIIWHDKLSLVEEEGPLINLIIS